MQVSDTANLQRMWGTKDCSHADVEKEFSLDIPTGQYTCVKCGQTFWFGDEARNKRRTAQ